MTDINLPLGNVIDPYQLNMASGVDPIFALMGPLTRVGRSDPYADRNVSMFNAPEAFTERNLYIRDTVEDWTFTAFSTFLTERCLPWKRTEDMHVVWSTWEANAHIMENTPEQSGSRAVTQRRSVKRATLTRVGLAAQYEDGFVKTQPGRRSIILSMAQISRSLQETANLRVVEELVGCHRGQHQFQQENRALAYNDLRSYLERDRARFMIAQKHPNGLEVLDAEISKEIADVGGRANGYITTDKPSIAQLSVPEKTQFWLRGQEGVDFLNGKAITPQAAGGTQGSLDNVAPVKLIRNQPVFVARVHALDGNVRPEILTRQREIGEYNTMIDECSDPSTYTTRSRHRRIFDERANEFVEIGLEEVINNSHIWGAGGYPEYPPDLPGHVEGVDARQDKRQDFLTFAREGEIDNRANVQYIGDLSKEFFSREDAESAGVTVLNAIYRGNEVRKNADMVAAAGLGSFNDAIVSLGLGENLSGFMNGLKSIFGGASNLMIDVEEGVDTGYSGIQDSIMTFVTGRVPVVRGAAPASDAAAALGKIDNAHLAHLKSLLPASFAEHAAAVIANTNETVGTRAEQLKSAILESVAKGENEYYGSADEAVQELKNASNAYTARRNAEVSKSQAMSQEERGYALAGTQLPEGWRYVYENHVNAQASRRFDVANLSAVRSMIASKAKSESQQPIRSSAGRRRRGAGGVSGIGEFIFPEGGTPEDQAARRVPEQGEENAFRRRFMNYNSLLNDLKDGSAPMLVKIAAAAYLGAVFTRDMMIKLAANDIIVPMNFLLFRPHMTYVTHTLIKLQLDGGAGNTYITQSDVQVSHDGYLKTGLIHYTTYIKPVVDQPRNVYVQHDIYCDRYIGGADTKYWDPATYIRACKERKRYLRDIIVAPIPYRERARQIPVVLSIAGRWYVERYQGIASQEEFARLHYSTAPRINAQYHLYVPGKDARRRDQVRTGAGTIARNLVCWKGAQYRGPYNDPKTYEINHGHRGPNIKDGSASVRNGEVPTLNNAYQISVQ